jgi:hypothetical protein
VKLPEIMFPLTASVPVPLPVQGLDIGKLNVPLFPERLPLTGPASPTI